MNCAEYEDRIALYIGGDLPAEEAVDVESHLAACPECAVFAAGMRESQSALKALAIGAPDPAVRRRVLATLEARRGRMRWMAVAAALFVVVAAGLVWRLQDTAQAPPQVARNVPEAPARRVEAPDPPTPAPTRLARTPGRERNSVRPVRRHAPPAPKFKSDPVLLARKTEPLVVKMLTDDPDVVIIWLVDGKEQNNEEAPLGSDGPRGD